MGNTNVEKSLACENIVHRLFSQEITPQSLIPLEKISQALDILKIFGEAQYPEGKSKCRYSKDFVIAFDASGSLIGCTIKAKFMDHLNIFNPTTSMGLSSLLEIQSDIDNVNQSSRRSTHLMVEFGFSEQEIDTIQKILKSILRTTKAMQDTQSLDVILEHLSSFEVPKEEIAAYIQKSVGEEITSPNSLSSHVRLASVVRHILGCIYIGVFQHVVFRINQVLGANRLDAARANLIVVDRLGLEYDEENTLCELTINHQALKHFHGLLLWISGNQEAMMTSDIDNLITNHSKQMDIHRIILNAARSESTAECLLQCFQSQSTLDSTLVAFNDDTIDIYAKEDSITYNTDDILFYAKMGFPEDMLQVTRLGLEFFSRNPSMDRTEIDEDYSDTRFVFCIFPTSAFSDPHNQEFILRQGLLQSMILDYIRCYWMPKDLQGSHSVDGSRSTDGSLRRYSEALDESMRRSVRSDAMSADGWGHESMSLFNGRDRTVSLGQSIHNAFQDSKHSETKSHRQLRYSGDFTDMTSDLQASLALNPSDLSKTLSNTSLIEDLQIQLKEKQREIDELHQKLRARDETEKQLQERICELESMTAKRGNQIKKMVLEIDTCTGQAQVMSTYKQRFQLLKMMTQTLVQSLEDHHLIEDSSDLQAIIDAALHNT
eukprot:TRINITY_DN5084_c0_g1_i8.p1 TRINITY_DN5084_c0_g1~~TRINITY_DN5084_c0_g1_i8.p1  ORF type:complete len:767 (-),score=130.19 TRINITY_DN5084_c0_g1_i8:423-2402(-)